MIWKLENYGQKLNLKITGTIGVLIKARKRNIITSTQEVLNRLRNEGFRISDEIEKEFLKYDM